MDLNGVGLEAQAPPGAHSQSGRNDVSLTLASGLNW